MASPKPTMPHLSPHHSSEETSTLSSLEKRKHKIKRSSFIFGRKDTPDVKPEVSTSEEPEDTPEDSNEASGSRGHGPDLRMLPREDEAAESTEVPAKSSRYVELPREAPDSQKMLHPVTENMVKYEWDYVWEHQRGFRFLSTPLFSSAGLLPIDPPPFTTIGLAPVPCTLEEFQLPSPEWRWAGDGWCVDMRGDGEVQEDGFEYNWWFRQNGWRPKIGTMSTGAYVRRRRWMRLRYLTPPEVTAEKPSDPSVSHVEPTELQGWEKVRAEMKDTELDRERLDFLKAWLDESSANEDLLRKHWTEALNMFVFPSSRDSLRSMVKSMGWKALPQGDEVIFWKVTA